MKTYLMILFLLFTGIIAYSYTNDNIEYNGNGYYSNQVDYTTKPELMTDSNIRLTAILGIIVLIIIVLLVVNYIDKRTALKIYYHDLGELIKIKNFGLNYTDIDEMDMIMEKISDIINKRDSSIKYYHDKIKFGINDPMFVMFFDIDKLEGKWCHGYKDMTTYYMEVVELKNKWKILDTSLNKLINTIREHDSYVLKEEYNLIWDMYTYIQKNYGVSLGYERYLGVNQERLKLLDDLIIEMGEVYMNDLKLALFKLKTYESELNLFKKTYENILESKGKYDKKK